MKHDYTNDEIRDAWKDSLSLHAFLAALPERPQAAEIASLKDSLFQAQEAAKDLLDQRDKAQAELSTLRQPILADDDRSLGQVLHEILDEGLSWDRLLKGDQEQCELAAQAVAAVVEARMIRRKASPCPIGSPALS